MQPDGTGQRAPGEVGEHALALADGIREEHARPPRRRARAPPLDELVDDAGLVDQVPNPLDPVPLDPIPLDPPSDDA